ncbi:UDP-glucoronosyl and UDP-glucosyl transferase domain-containing protein [Ditylenchus destructor]|uniref:UDP-glucuronosyltransferase n=1 Tax=Ditylenchus destructor TaxID=166010 RepID=A0AAD4NBQ2_9BILA|nr:UDP-glucoronosyl and UDP-glucosyl transferase domain-containing protein [Ditylenchus destructor]
MTPYFTKLASRGHHVYHFHTVTKEVQDFGPNVHYIKAYLPPAEHHSREELAATFWNGSITTMRIVDVYRDGNSQLGRLMLNYSEQIREILNQEWDLIVSDDLFWALGFCVPILKVRQQEKGLYQNSKTRFVVYATAGQTLMSAETVKSTGRNWVSKTPLFPYFPEDQEDYFNSNYFMHRLYGFRENLLDLVTLNYLIEKFLMPNIATFGVPNFTWHGFYTKSSFVFADSIDRLGWAMPEGNEMKNVGAHCKKPKPLTGDLKEFVEDPKSKGTIFIAFGTYADWEYAPKHIEQAFVGALNRLSDYRIIWANNAEKTLSDIRPHIRLVKWAPQLDLLSHPNTKAFLTHGGLKSIREGFCAAIPLVFMPLFAEQAHNAHMALALKLGSVINKYTVNEDVLYDTINDALVNPSRKTRAQALRSIFLDRPMEAMDEAAFHTERLFRAKLGRRVTFLRRGMDLTWTQFLYFDLLLVVIPLFFIIKR